MAENPGLENHRIKSFKNKGRDVEVSVLPRSGSAWPRRPRGGGEGRGAGAGIALAGSRWVRVGRRLPSPGPGLGGAGAGTGAGCSRPSGAAGARAGKRRGFRPRHAGAACCLRGRDVELRRGPPAGGLAGPRCRRPGPSAAPPRGGGWPRLAPVAGGASRRRCPLGASRAAAHGASALRVPAPTFCELGPGGRWRPQRGVGTSRVTDWVEGGGWGRVGCARTIFLCSVFQSCPLDQPCRALPARSPVTAGIWSRLKVDNSLPSIVSRL